MNVKPIFFAIYDRRMLSGAGSSAHAFRFEDNIEVHDF
jgi:hypothetical protein